MPSPSSAPHPPKALLFDLDGTLVDSLADIAASVNWVRSSVGVTELSIQQVRSMIGDGARKLLDRALDRTEFTVDDVWPRFLDHHADQCTRQVQCYPNVLERLTEWHDAGHPLAVVTNKPERFAARILDHLQLAPLFHSVVGGDTTPHRKPSPAPILAALDQLGTREGTMIGDSLQDLISGKAAGLRTIAVLYGFHDEAPLRQEGADAFWSAFGVPAEPDC